MCQNEKVKRKKKDNLVELDAFLATGGFTHAPRPAGALARARRMRDARVEKPPAAPAPKAAVAMPKILRARTIQARNIIHGFSTRVGGVSTAFGGRDLNLGGQLDGRAAIEQNRTRFVAALCGGKKSGKQKLRLVTLKQVHSDIIHILTARPKGALTGDGMITNLPGLLLAVQVADCVPILLADPKRRVVGAFHAGWRGTVKRIAEKGAGDMRALFGSEPQDMVAAIGPCIGGCCYAVGDEVVEQFRSQFSYADKLFHRVHDDDVVKKKYPLLFLTARAPGHSDIGPQTHLDLVEANRRQLLAAGLKAKNIWSSGLCTSCTPRQLFSHRKEQGFTGRMMGAIALV